VRLPQAGTIALDVHPDWLWVKGMSMLHHKLQFPVEAQRLTWESKDLPPMARVGDSGLASGDCVLLGLRIRGGAKGDS
jgi:hypothetical protein